jgi:hypothetical protein
MFVELIRYGKKKLCIWNSSVILRGYGHTILSGNSLVTFRRFILLPSSGYSYKHTVLQVKVTGLKIIQPVLMSSSSQGLWPDFFPKFHYCSPGGSCLTTVWIYPLSKVLVIHACKNWLCYKGERADSVVFVASQKKKKPCGVGGYTVEPIRGKKTNLHQHRCANLISYSKAIPLQVWRGP